MNSNSSQCPCERCQLERKFESICAKIKSKRDREWLMDDREHITGYVRHLESVIEDIMDSCGEETKPKRLPRRGEGGRRR